MLEPWKRKEIKNGQWLGVTVRSQGNGGKVRKLSFIIIIIIIENSKENRIYVIFLFSFKQVLVCAHRYIILEAGESQHGQGLCYVLENDFTFDESYEPCKGRPTERDHEDYGYCQAGTSGILLEDGTMILGTPGPFTWRGTIFVISVGGKYLDRDKTMYYGPHNDQNSPVEKYSYLG